MMLFWCVLDVLHRLQSYFCFLEFGFLEHTREYGERGLGGDIFMPLPRFSTSIDSIHHDVFGAGFISLLIKKN